MLCSTNSSVILPGYSYDVQLRLNPQASSEPVGMVTVQAHGRSGKCPGWSELTNDSVSVFQVTRNFQWPQFSWLKPWHWLWPFNSVSLNRKDILLLSEWNAPDVEVNAIDITLKWQQAIHAYTPTRHPVAPILSSASLLVSVKLSGIARIFSRHWLLLMTIWLTWCNVIAILLLFASLAAVIFRPKLD